MAEIILRLPSKQVQYGYVEVKGTPEEFGTELSAPNSIGMMYATYVGQFLAGEKAGVELVAKGLEARSVEPPPGDPQAAAQRLAEDKKPRTVGEDAEMTRQAIAQIMSDRDVDTEEEAAALLKKELGAIKISEEENETFAELVQDGQGYQVGDTVTVAGIEFTKHSDVPWDREVAPKRKPWENGGPRPAVADIDW